ncbi:hypothetical protein GQ43DRAFT_476026 [Delitschia confertaspora ATCC 74209]|uniref:Fermentation associated protein n=1 Tax=Delitschia confertaspora ATCC 74209 TaxID=1513339 RepID=A0A9P4MU59_9PLEO|nr:hypothetical protein GQ43DRAFT_476026 [Delitschia confertaspora ATCC 74209]
MAGGIVSEPLNPHTGFNWVFLVELLICGILTVFFLFYFNRLFATLVSYAIRAYTWHTYRAYIDIQALQISLLGGRIFFKDIRYHGHNETILIHGGYITWRYWLRRVRDADIHSVEDGDRTPLTEGSRPKSRNKNVDKAETGGLQPRKRLPCRISIKVSGVEAFMYNRSPAYDGIIEAVRRKGNSGARHDGIQTEDVAQKDSKDESVNGAVGGVSEHSSKQHNRLKKDGTREKNIVQEKEAEVVNAGQHNGKPPEVPSFLRLLPVHIDCNKGAIVVGNENTPAVITVQFEKASGEFDASPSGPLDVYQQVFNFQFTHPVVHMKPNPDFKSAQLETALLSKQEGKPEEPEHDSYEKATRSKETRKRWIDNLLHLSGLFSKSVDSINAHPKHRHGKSTRGSKLPPQYPGQEQWKGLTRYLEEGDNEGHGEWDSVEYAKTSLIADCPCVNVSFYWDVTGPVPQEAYNNINTGRILPGNINRGLAPEYGMDIQIFGGIVNYGPWTDRHRAVFQNFFFPGSYVDAIPAKQLDPGDIRVLTLFKIYISIEQDVVLRIPIREPSKDWKWKGKAHTVTGDGNKGGDKTKSRLKGRRKYMRGKQREADASGPNVRPFGWIDVKIAGNSSVNYLMDMIASEKGFNNKLHVDIVGTEISSSVNHGLLWRSGAVGLDCDISTPLSWNTLRKWTFNISCHGLELFLLRDHLFLLTDLVADWGTGPLPNYFTFVPFRYLLNIELVKFKLYLNTNDSNIVNNPSDPDDNSFVILFGQQLHGKVTIPLDRLKPLQNEIRFDVSGQDMGMDMSMPPKNTLNTFVASRNVAKLGSLTLTGSHTYMTQTSASNTDRLYLDIQGSKLALELYGFLVHHFMKIKDNYFGEDMHFKTLEEFQELPSQGHTVDGPNIQPTKISNDLDVILCIAVDQGTVLLPANLYSAEKSLHIDLPYVSADLRFTNYYMDLMVDFSPLSISLGTSIAKQDLPNDYTGQTELFIDSVAIYGHRLFGLPPAEPTYVCNWDFKVGAISGECTPEFIEKTIGAVRSFAFTFDDDENSLPVTQLPVIHDTTFLRLKTKDVRVWFHVADEAIMLSTAPVSLYFNDLAGKTFSQRLTVLIPDLIVGAVDALSASRHRTRAGEKRIVETHAFLQTSVSLNMLRRKLDFEEERDKQQAHMQEHDKRTGRTPFLFTNPELPTGDLLPNHQSKVKPSAMPFPEIPNPIFLSQPQSIADDSSVVSGYSYRQGSVLKRELRTGSLRTSSSSSFTQSIRSAHQFQPHAQRKVSAGQDGVKKTYVLATDDERRKRNLPPSSVALSSWLAAPYFPLEQVEPDMSDVPPFPKTSPKLQGPDTDMGTFNDISFTHMDDSTDHTSFLFSVQPGIRVFCTPEAIRCIASLLDLIFSGRPEDLLDAFQVKVLTEILDNQKRREGKGKSLEFSVRVPFIHVRFANAFTHQLEGASGLGKDQYDLILKQLKLAARIRSFATEQGGEDTVSLHTTLASASISVTEKAEIMPQDDVAVYAELTDLLLWVLKSKSASVNVSFRSFEVATASQKIEYLASLIHRTTLLGTELSTSFEDVDAKRQMRLRSLAWFLTNAENQSPDPSFLARPSYTLRAAREHLRNHDSWKIISRFRFIWQCLSDEEKAKIHNHCSRSLASCPDNAEEKVIALWNQWRTWDLNHVKESLAMRTLFGSCASIEPDSAPMPLYVEIRSAGIKFIIDPGPKQSEVDLSIVSINVAIIPPLPPSGLMLVRNQTTNRSVVVQINAQDSAIRLSWEICELVENLIRMFQEDKKRRSSVAEPPSKTMVPYHLARNDNSTDYQFIFATEKGEIALDTINLRSISIGYRLRCSVVLSESIQSKTTTFLIHLEQGVTELFSRSRLLLRSQSDFPSLYFSLSEFLDRDGLDEIKFVGISRMITVHIAEDVLGLLEVLDAVIRDEVVYICDQIVPLQNSRKAEAANSSGPSEKLPNITVALLMDSYLVDITVLQSLIWSISGSSGRLSVSPAISKDVTLTVDYDLDSHVQRMYSRGLEDSNVITTLELPPLNGTLKLTKTNTQTGIFASGMVETITLQASEIQALVATINKPEISSMIHTIRGDISTLKKHLAEIFPDVVKSPAVESEKSGTDIAFSIQMTFSGLRILASAPGQLQDATMANLAFKLASIQVKATNISTRDQNTLIPPEVTAALQQIGVEMTLSDNKTVRRCGDITFGALFHTNVQTGSDDSRRIFHVRSSGLEVNVFAETASAVVDVLNHLQDKIKDLDLSRERKYLKKLRKRRNTIFSAKHDAEPGTDVESVGSGGLFTSAFSVELSHIQISWIVGNSIPPYPTRESEDLVLSFRKINLSTRKDDSARLKIEDMQLQMVPVSADKKKRSLNSALLPEVVFNVAYSSTKDNRKLAFQAVGKSLDLRLESRFVLPANVLERSIALAGKRFRAASANWNMTPAKDGGQRKNPFGNKRLVSLLVDADFAGAVVHLQSTASAPSKESRSQQKGRYSQFVGDETTNSTSLRAPGIALKVEYKDDGQDPSLNAEFKINASSNTLFPTVVPLIIDISNSIKEVVREKDELTGLEKDAQINKAPTKVLEEDNLITADPSAYLGKTRLNLGLRICKQEFSLSCQPIARVAAIAKLEDIYVTVNSVKSQEHGHFFAGSATFEKLQATVQHVYSRESTFGFDVDSIVLSLMNSKHLSGTSGISAILKINPMRLQVNARQLQDFLLFREIWYPPEIRQASKAPTANASVEAQEYLIQRYQQVTTATAFPWNANVALADISVELDLGQAIGRTSLNISNLWASSKKSTNREQNMCIGVEKIAVESTGRTSGFIELSGVKVRTSISWPPQILGLRQTPLVQASVGFNRLRAKAGFDYQAFVIADISNFDFLMYNVRHSKGSQDRLVAVLDGDKVHVFCTATSAAQGLALFQAVERLVQENQQAYAQSLKDIEKFLRRKSAGTAPSRTPSQNMLALKGENDSFKTPISLHTDVVVTLRSTNIGVFPSSFVDNQIFLVEASDTQARFAVALEEGKIHSGLGMTLGQLSVALATVSQSKKGKAVTDLTVDEVLESARSARGGTILRVPKVIATMHTWQKPESNHIDYTFRSSFEGKVDVGWNYSRISYIRNMWTNHSRTLASRLGKPLPESALKITATEKESAQKPSKGAGSSGQKGSQEQEKITAVVNVPLSKYEYTALEAPLIEAPQLRDMGEATPPLEWIGLHRERLPNVTHQIVIVALLEVAREVEDAYERILGSS